MTGASYGCVVLTQGRRPQQLREALESVLAQTGVDVDVVVVCNGGRAGELPEGVRRLELPEDLGIPGGRAAGVPLVSGDLLLFVDDDAALLDPGTLAEIARRFNADPSLGLLQPRVQDPDGRTAGRWVPRLRVGDPARSSDVAAVWEGVVVARPEAYHRSGGWPVELRYGHEGVDLAWGTWDAGFRVRYAGDLVVRHPRVPAARHAGAQRVWARNRVWLARRRLPAPVGVLYVLVWLVLTVARTRPRRDVVPALLGFSDGLRRAPAMRRPVSWRAVWRMTRAGRPPVI